ncbi:MAG: hypothetical protein IH991_15240, partial [Planctomycetes bacterium]|nr:hypothetical protein [Planctomycetota bacterium]
MPSAIRGNVPRDTSAGRLETLGGIVEDRDDAGVIIVSAFALLLRLSVLSYVRFVHGIGRKIGSVGPADDAKLVDARLREGVEITIEGVPHKRRSPVRHVDGINDSAGP